MRAAVVESLAVNEIEKADLNQSLKAYLIPSLLFVATLITAAGMFIIYSGNSAGWPFVAVGGTIMLWSFWALITFHNEWRAKGQYHDLDKVGKKPNEIGPRPEATTSEKPLTFAAQREKEEALR